METLDAILHRRSIRKYTAEPLTPMEEKELLRAAFAAPSACDKRSRAFVVVRDKETLQGLRKIYLMQPMLSTCAAAVVICGDTLKMPIHDMLVCDGAAACENLLLRAADLGLGACWGGVFRAAQVEKTRKLLGLPAHVLPLAVVSVGHPAEEKPAEDRYDEGCVFADKWGK